MAIEERYRLIAYVGRGKDDSRPHWIADEGFKTFRSIFIHRLPWARFAVLETTDRKFLIVDLFETAMDLAEFTILMPPPHVFTDKDTAVIAAQMKL